MPENEAKRRQAEKWEDFLPYVNKLEKLMAMFPSPPMPDDQLAQKLNDINRSVEGLGEQVRGRVQMEQEA